MKRMLQYSSMDSTSKPDEEKLFWGIWLRWSALSAAERCVCILIVLIPLWWVLGIIPYLLLCTSAGVAVYEWWRYGKVRLKRPSLGVIALLAYYAYQCVETYLLYFNVHPLVSLPPDANLRLTGLVESFLNIFALPGLVWYIQSHKVKVRLSVVVWAFSVSVIEMLGAWLFSHFILGNAYYQAPRTVWAILTGKPKLFYRGIGNSNYLNLYWHTDKAIAGLTRHYSFFYHASTFGQYVGLVGTFILEIKDRLRSNLLLAACAFLIGISGTRTIWIAFPLVVFFHLFLSTTKLGGKWFPFALAAIVSFVCLSLPPINEWVIDTSTDTATLIAEFRGNSTEDRAAIYTGSLAGSLENPINFIFGHVVTGEGGLGTHSFWMGTLLYKGGLINTGMFLTFWFSWLVWLYRTRQNRPTCCFSIWLFFSLIFVTQFFNNIAPLAIPLSMTLYKPLRRERNTTRCTSF